MVANVASRVLDLGLNVLDIEVDRIYICSAEPTTFTEATSTFALGSKNWGAGNAFGSPAAGSPNGRKVTSVAITDGVVSATNASPGAGFVGIVDFANSRLIAVAILAAAQAVTTGNPFTLAAFDIRLPDR